MDSGTYVISALHLRGCELGVVRAATSRVNPPTRDPLLQNGIVNLEVQYLVDLDTLLFESGI